VALRAGAGALLRRLQYSSNRAEHSPNLLPSRWARAINASDADVVNLHWMGAETMSVADIGRIEKPVVWTLHDMWAFCGSEHLADTGPSARWRRGYDSVGRPPGDGGLDLDRYVWERKRSAWRRPFFLVAPSRWLAGCAASSALLSGWSCATIPNLLDTSRFAPVDRTAARRALGLPETGAIVLFGGGWSDPNKGYDLLVAALEEMARGMPALLPFCVAFGEAPPRSGQAAPFPIQWLGRIDDAARLAKLYSAADVTVVPSRLENLPQAATEAQACGCPVAAFSVGGLPDAVEHGVTGFLAEPCAPAALARAIAWVLTDAERHLRLRAQARERALRLWSPGVVTPRYLEAYAAAISGSGRIKSD
jgi:glycosyltransferase involved in cell wall biosynthesis